MATGEKRIFSSIPPPDLVLPSTSFKILVEELKVREKSLQCDPGLSITGLSILQAVLSDLAAKYRPWQTPERQITAKSERSMTGIYPLPKVREAPHLS